MTQEQERTLNRLDRLEDTFADGKLWCKGALFSGDKCCLAGGIEKVTKSGPARWRLRDLIKSVVPIDRDYGERPSIEGYNDRDNTKFRDIKRILAKARNKVLANTNQKGKN